MCGQNRLFRCGDGLSVRVSVALAPALPTLAFHTERSAWPVSRGSERTPPVKLSYKAKPTVGTPATWLEGRQRCVAERFRLSLQFLSTIVGVFLELERAPYVSRDARQPNARYFSFEYGCAPDTGQKKKKKKWAAVTELHRRE
eukprot:227872_1